jgi:integrase
MLAAASPRDAALVVLMCVGAMRVGEATLLAWQDVEECSIEIPGGVTKTGHGRRFTLPPAACQWLQAWREVAEISGHRSLAALERYLDQDAAREKAEAARSLLVG